MDWRNCFGHATDLNGENAVTKKERPTFVKAPQLTDFIIAILPNKIKEKFKGWRKKYE